jgi:hypothetical protein
MNEGTRIAVALCLAIPLLVVVAGRRRAMARRCGVFRCSIRPAGARDGSQAWLGGRARAHWFRDVLIVEAGVFRDARRTLVVREAHAIVERRNRGPRHVVSIRLELRDGSTVEVATARRHLDLLGGPFLTAHPTLQRPPADQSR